MISYLLLLRIQNLLMITLTQLLVSYCIIMPSYFAEYGSTGVLPEHLTHIEFLLLLFSIVVIAAGGYIINDALDVYTDEINKPGKNIVGQKISIQSARTLAYVLFFLGSIVGL